MKTKQIAAMLAGPSLMALTSTTQVHAAESADSVKAMEEVIVTARRREESLQEVPQTVNVVSDETMKDYVILDFKDISDLVPGLTLEGGTTGYQSNASVRGVRYQIESQASGPTTEFYLNEAPIEPNLVFQAQYDIGQIEVLKGPQGTMRGRSAPSGAFTLTTRAADPNGGFNGYAATTIDDHAGFNLQGAINLPIVSDKLALRIAVLHDENDANGIQSVTTRAKPKQETDSYRASLTFTPWESLRTRFMFQHLDRIQETYGSLVVGPGSTPFRTNQPPITLEQRRSVRDNPSANDQAQKMATGNIEYTFAKQVLSYVGGWYDFELEDDSEGDPNNFIIGPPLPLNNHATTKGVSHELRLASEEPMFGGLLDYTVGFFHLKKYGLTNNPSPGSIFSGAFGIASAPDPTIYNENYARITRVLSSRDNPEQSFFGGVDIHLGKSWDLSLGARHIVQERHQSIRATQEGSAPGGVQRVNLGVVTNCTGAITGSSIFPAGVTLGTGVREPSPFYPGTCDAVFATPFPVNLSPPINDKTSHNVWSASLSYDVTDAVMVYATAATSFRQGPGFVTGGPGTTCTNLAYCLKYVTLEPETSISYETGFKANLFDRSYLEVSLFQQTFDGFITRGIFVPYRRTSAGSNTITGNSFTYNADVIVKGFDALFNFEILSGWNSGLSVSYADGKYDDALIPCRDSNFDGIPDANPLPGTNAANPLGTAAAWDAAGGPGGPALCRSNGSSTRAPNWNASLRSQYDFPLFDNTTGFVRGLYTYYPENKNSDESQNFVVSSYGILNLFAGVRTDDRAWEFSVFARNVLNDDTMRSLADDATSQGFTNAANNQPIFGNTVTYRTYSIVPEREFGLTLRYSFGGK